mmetsp:Transcript_108157/g.191448  ORF Transcript_108157/g.191448 Transcript_108157/m.191448 type:complete len:225 (+) Transcript_108157:78-752(+)
MAVEPKLGSLPITFAFYIVALVHLIQCIGIIGGVVVGYPLNIEGVVIGTTLQWLYGTFTMITMITIILAAIGCLYLIGSHLDLYYTVLALSLFIDLALFVVFLIYGKSCKTTHRDSDHLIATISCGIQDGTALLCLTLFVLYKVIALWVTSKTRGWIKVAYNDKLAPFLQRVLSPPAPVLETVTGTGQMGKTLGPPKLVRTVGPFRVPPGTAPGASYGGTAPGL